MRKATTGGRLPSGRSSPCVDPSRSAAIGPVHPPTDPFWGLPMAVLLLPCWGFVSCPVSRVRLPILDLPLFRAPTNQLTGPLVFLPDGGTHSFTLSILRPCSSFSFPPDERVCACAPTSSNSSMPSVLCLVAAVIYSRIHPTLNFFHTLLFAPIFFVSLALCFADIVAAVDGGGLPVRPCVFFLPSPFVSDPCISPPPSDSTIRFTGPQGFNTAPFGLSQRTIDCNTAWTHSPRHLSSAL